MTQDSAFGSTVTFDQPVLFLDDTLLQKGGTAKTVTTIANGAATLNITATVANAGTVTTPGGTFKNCRSIVTKASVVGEPQAGDQVIGGFRETIVAPGAGIVKGELFEGGSGWATLVGGTAGGLLVGKPGYAPLEATFNGLGKAQISGIDGSLTVSNNSVPLQTNHSYTITAQSVDGSVFDHWTIITTTNGVESTVNVEGTALTFTMEANLVLEATFDTPPFVLGAGSYRGLFFPAANATVNNTGYVSLAVTKAGGFTGYFETGQTRHAIHGNFDAHGHFAQTVPIGSSSWALAMTLHGTNALDLTNGVQGTVSDGVWTSGLAAYKALAAYNLPKVITQLYSVGIDGTNDGSGLPEGDGCASLSLNNEAEVGLNGWLADGAQINYSTTFLDSDHGWVLYLPLYNGGGCLAGWGNAQQWIWIKPASASGYFRQGFSFMPSVTQDDFIPSAPLGEFGVDSFYFSGGDLASPFFESVNVNGNTIIDQGESRLTATYNAKTGLIQGQCVNPNSPSEWLKFKGVFFQEGEGIHGYFLGANQGGFFGQ
ncbi:MAG: hypothetical protein ACLQVY_15655 [Limisphaerales bacterium]